MRSRLFRRLAFIVLTALAPNPAFADPLLFRISGSLSTVHPDLVDVFGPTGTSVTYTFLFNPANNNVGFFDATFGEALPIAGGCCWGFVQGFPRANPSSIFFEMHDGSILFRDQTFDSNGRWGVYAFDQWLDYEPGSLAPTAPPLVSPPGFWPSPLPPSTGGGALLYVADLTPPYVWPNGTYHGPTPTVGISIHDVRPIPEPTSLALLVIGAAGLPLAVRRSRRRNLR